MRKCPGDTEENCSAQNTEHFWGRDLMAQTAPERKGESERHRRLSGGGKRDQGDTTRRRRSGTRTTLQMR
ncbi:hypothetical protein NDU88_007131 [Pleurodeles waltl]|uniref:Uncharacterized protein n=1 Tax=Pleurodeles waltl TaxID=8319 RepID=A0AAV7UNI3_PLEWA|nr:hypothetical protein NDU88_007131 [Pleurodeles waltl]